MKENWNAEQFSPYDAAMRRFNYIIGILDCSGEVETIFHLPWFQSDLELKKENDAKKLWELEELNFSPPLIKAVKELINSSGGQTKKHFNLKISGYQFQWEPVDFILLPEGTDKIRFELFYPRVVKEGEPCPPAELNFELVN